MLSGGDPAPYLESFARLNKGMEWKTPFFCIVPFQGSIFISKGMRRKLHPLGAGDPSHTPLAPEVALCVYSSPRFLNSIDLAPPDSRGKTPPA